MTSFITNGRHGYAVKFSQFHSNQLVVSTSQLYGNNGAGSLYFLQFNDIATTEIHRFEWKDGLFDVDWSKTDENIVVTSSGDGTLQLWNLYNLTNLSKPLSIYYGHLGEIYSIDWGNIWNNNTILSSSWDSKIKIWDPINNNPILSFQGSERSLVYGAFFAPKIPNLFASVSNDGKINFYNSLDFSGKPLFDIQAHTEEALTCDWHKTDGWILATGGSDGLIKGWDLRNLKESIFDLLTSEYAVRKIKFSPFSSKLLASVDFDCTTKIWDVTLESAPLEVFRDHSDYVYGVDWNLNIENQIADCGWDSKVNIFSITSVCD